MFRVENKGVGEQRSQPQEEHEHVSKEQRDPAMAEDDGFTMGDLARLMRAYSPAIRLIMLAIAVAFVLVAITAYIALPAARTSSVNVRLMFRGADMGRYPNGTPFSAAEVVSPVVLTKVYRHDGLEGFLTFSEFKASLYVVLRNDELEALTSQYRAKLADPRLTPVDRARIEQEFREKKDSLTKADLSLVFVTREHLRQLPLALREKILTDVLSTWAEETVDEKGILLFDIAILSSGSLDDLTKMPDYLISLDLLRTKLQQMQQNIDQLDDLPGAKVLRASSSNRSLAELHAALNVLATYRIQPLLGTLAHQGISRDALHSEEFLRTAIAFSELRVAEAQARVEALRSAIERYAAETRKPPSDIATGWQGMPMVDASFLDRILQLGSQETDLKYRQKLVDEYRAEALNVVPLEAETRYYRDLQARFNVRRPPTAGEALRLDAELQSIVADARKAADEVYEIYTALSQDLNPSTALYSVNEPITHLTQRPVSVGTYALLGIVLIIASFPIVILGCAVHARFFAQSSRSVDLGERTKRESLADAPPVSPIDEPAG